MLGRIFNILVSWKSKEVIDKWLFLQSVLLFLDSLRDFFEISWRL